MSRRKRVMNCVMVSRFHKPETVYRWFRRYKMRKLVHRIEHLSEEVAKFGRRYVRMPNWFVISEPAKEHKPVHGKRGVGY